MLINAGSRMIEALFFQCKCSGCVFGDFHLLSSDYEELRFIKGFQQLPTDRLDAQNSFSMR